MYLSVYISGGVRNILYGKTKEIQQVKKEKKGRKKIKLPQCEDK